MIGSGREKMAERLLANWTVVAPLLRFLKVTDIEGSKEEKV